MTSKQDFSQERLICLLAHPLAVLRHDVDYDPMCALQMAKLEGQIGVHSTYYIRPLECYEPGARLALAEIPLHGHDLAPHVDLHLPRDAEVDDELMALTAEQDFELLSESFPMTRKVSFHAPPQDIHWRDVEGFDHALKGEWFGRYLADSRGVWRFPPEQLLSWGEVIQLNLHPEWWFWEQAEADAWRRIEAKKP